MIRKIILMIGLLSLFDIASASESRGFWSDIGKAFQSSADRIEKKQQKQVKTPIVVAEPKKVIESSVNCPGVIQRALCATVAVPVAMARYAQSALQVQEQQKTEPWFWQQWQKPAAVDIASYSLAPWYGHAAHGYYHRLKNFNNEDLRHYSSMWQRVKALDFATFNKWHPIQSMKGSKRMMWPLVGPIIAAHATGLAYHAAVEHTPGLWYSKQRR